MAFVSIGQKYGFVSAGDEFRKELAEARAETQKDEFNSSFLHSRFARAFTALTYCIPCRGVPPSRPVESGG